MKLGQFTSGYQFGHLEDAFRDARDFGYDYVELWGGRPHAFAPDLRRDGVGPIRALSDKYDMPIRVYTPEHNAYPYNFMIGTEAMREDAIDYLKLSMEIGEELGAEYMLFSPAQAGYIASNAEIHDRLFKSVGEMVSHAEKVGIKLIIEALTPFESNVCLTAGDLAEVLDAFQTEALVGMCDVVPPTIIQEPISSYFDKLGPRLGHLHIMDSDCVTETHLIPGEGTLPLRELMSYVESTGYDGGITIELVTNYLREPTLSSHKAIDGLRSVIPAS